MENRVCQRPVEIDSVASVSDTDVARVAGRTWGG